MDLGILKSDLTPGKPRCQSSWPYSFWWTVYQRASWSLPGWGQISSYCIQAAAHSIVGEGLWDNQAQSEEGTVSTSQLVYSGSVLHIVVSKRLRQKLRLRAEIFSRHQEHLLSVQGGHVLKDQIWHSRLPWHIGRASSRSSQILSISWNQIMYVPTAQNCSTSYCSSLKHTSLRAWFHCRCRHSWFASCSPKFFLLSMCNFLTGMEHIIICI